MQNILRPFLKQRCRCKLYIDTNSRIFKVAALHEKCLCFKGYQPKEGNGTLVHSTIIINKTCQNKVALNLVFLQGTTKRNMKKKIYSMQGQTQTTSRMEILTFLSLPTAKPIAVLSRPSMPLAPLFPATCMPWKSRLQLV